MKLALNIWCLDPLEAFFHRFDFQINQLRDRNAEKNTKLIPKVYQCCAGRSQILQNKVFIKKVSAPERIVSKQGPFKKKGSRRCSSVSCNSNLKFKNVFPAVLILNFYYCSHTINDSRIYSINLCMCISLLNRICNFFYVLRHVLLNHICIFIYFVYFACCLGCL